MATQDSQIGREISDNLHETTRFEFIYQKIAQLFYPLYVFIFSERNNFISKVDLKLRQAERSEPVEIYMSAYMGMGALSGIISGIMMSTPVIQEYHSIFIYPMGFDNALVELIWVNATVVIGSILLGIVTASIFGMIGMLSGITFAYYIPEQTIRKRRSEINMLLPDAIAFMYCQSAGGMERTDIIREIAASENIYGEVSVEFQRIVHQIDNLSKDYHTAISNVSENTPSEELSSFLNSMLSTITSGGKMDDFLETQLSIFMENVKNTQQSELDNLELFNEIYITLSLIPVMLIIIGSFASSLGIIGVTPLMLLAYFLIPIVQFTALLVITLLFQTDYGEGELTPDEEDNYDTINDNQSNIFSVGIVEDYREGSKLFEQVYANETQRRLFNFVANPLKFAREEPSYVFIITVPIAIVFFILAIISGNVILSYEYLTNNAFRMTLFGFYVPIMIAIGPFIYFYDYGLYKRGKITDGLTEDLNKLANTNEQGITLQESMLITAQDNNTLLAEELKKMYKKQEMKIPLGQAIIEANNKYKIPRLARIFRIIKSAQGMSSNITQVLKTASDLSSTQAKIIRERETRTKQQIAVVVIIYFVYIISLIMMQLFILPDGGNVSQIGGEGLASIGGSGEPVDQAVISMLFFHGGIIQGGIAGLICGYIRKGHLSPGIKYSLALITITMLVWVGVA